MQRKFRATDGDGSGALSFGEFKKALGETNMPTADADARLLFDHFDKVGERERERERESARARESARSVSYTHLTLPTILLV